MNRNILLITIFVLFYCVTQGQISTQETPISFNTDIPELELSNQTHKILPSLDMNIINQEDAEDEINGIPPRFGYRHNVNYNLENSGKWVNLHNGSRIHLQEI